MKGLKVQYFQKFKNSILLKKSRESKLKFKLVRVWARRLFVQEGAWQVWWLFCYRQSFPCQVIRQGCIPSLYPWWIDCRVQGLHHALRFGRQSSCSEKAQLHDEACCKSPREQIVHEHQHRDVPSLAFHRWWCDMSLLFNFEMYSKRDFWSFEFLNFW